MTTAIVQYNAGNIRSVLYALERIGTTAIVTDDPEQLRSADKVIFPGVGEASSAMAYLKERGLDQVIAGLTQPVLGICLGMQLMCSWSEENDTVCLGIFPEKVKRFRPADKLLKVPQIGWNNITRLKSSLFEGVAENSYCYFVHGYHAAIGSHTIATTDYGGDYSSGLHRENFYGVQFHPEKSAAVGEQILRNFLFKINT
ncbi:imidazole glycerol phosphate synthase subunit HisH [Flavihumibacter petaseus]|uniref:Imidazole glycerol phosphate synthase subunit HisH n=1 Tax=Flavihumibacter petaseus NBRC 106054 TaxID=1220578 RepID=A0A0E9N166_9BACT|nr:imidazole glycerol phosphate synthase subunit HisH [Flavihumibacter petaseus]GAO43483.1 imidazole glycerol phosphate synthase subunit HisH [Flavihumibacter petaseus NBRC 106054]